MILTFYIFFIVLTFLLDVKEMKVHKLHNPKLAVLQHDLINMAKWPHFKMAAWPHYNMAAWHHYNMAAWPHFNMAAWPSFMNISNIFMSCTKHCCGHPWHRNISVYDLRPTETQVWYRYDSVFVIMNKSEKQTIHN